MISKPNPALVALLLSALAAGACSDDGGDAPTDPGPTPPAPVATVAVQPTALALSVGQSQLLAVTLRDAQDRILTGRAQQFSSSTPAVATVSATGQVTAVAEGEASITVASEGKTATTTVTVGPVPVAAVQIAPGALDLDLGGSGALIVTLRDAQGNVLTGRAITFTSANAAVATVNEAGMVTAAGRGSTYITAASEGRSADVLVVVHVPVAHVEIVAAPDTIEAWDVVPLRVVLRDIEGNVLEPRPTEWTTSDSLVATVDPATGLLTGVDRGVVTITATREGIDGTASIEVVIRYRSVVAGTMHACDLASGGIAWCWGLNSIDGRIGLEQVGDGVFRSEPHRVPGDHRFVQLTTFSRFTCGLTREGKAWCWGTNNWGSLGNGTNIPFSATPVAVAGNRTFTRLTAGADHACGVEAGSGQLLCWGHNDWGQFGRGNTASSNVPVPAAGGMVVSSAVVASSATCALSPAGKAWCWGANNSGQSGNGLTIPYGNQWLTTPVEVVGNRTFTSLSMGNHFVCGLTQGGQGYCWGSNLGKFGNGNGTDSSTPVPMGSGMAFKTISAGSGHMCGVNTQDEVWCWGGNRNGQLGAVAPNGSTVPLRAGGNLRAAEVAAAGIGTGSGAHTCAISLDRLTTWCWGRNEVGQSGNGTTSLPEAVNPLPSIVVGQRPR